MGGQADFRVLGMWLVAVKDALSCAGGGDYDQGATSGSQNFFLFLAELLH